MPTSPAIDGLDRAPLIVQRAVRGLYDAAEQLFRAKLDGKAESIKTRSEVICIAARSALAAYLDAMHWGMVADVAATTDVVRKALKHGAETAAETAYAKRVQERLADLERAAAGNAKATAVHD